MVKTTDREERRHRFYRRQYQTTLAEQIKLVGVVLRKLRKKIPLRIKVDAFIGEPTGGAVGETGFNEKTQRLEIIVAAGIDHEATTQVVVHEYAHCINMDEGFPEAGHGPLWGDAFARAWVAYQGGDRAAHKTAFAVPETDP